MQVPVHEVVAHHHLHAHVVEDVGKPTWRLTPKIQRSHSGPKNRKRNKRPSCQNRSGQKGDHRSPFGPLKIVAKRGNQRMKPSRPSPKGSKVDSLWFSLPTQLAYMGLTTSPTTPGGRKLPTRSATEFCEGMRGPQMRLGLPSSSPRWP